MTNDSNETKKVEVSLLGQVQVIVLNSNFITFNNRDFAVKFMTRVFFQIYRSDAWTVVLVGLLFFVFLGLFL